MESAPNPEHLRLVEQLYDPETREDAFRELQDLGKSALPAIRAGFADLHTAIDVSARLVSRETKHYLVDEAGKDQPSKIVGYAAAFEAFAELLEEHLVPSDLPLLTRYSEYPEADIGAKATFLIGCLCEHASLPMLLKVIEAGGQRLEGALNGLEHATERGPLQPSMVEELWPAIVHVCTQEVIHTNPYRILAGLDRDRFAREFVALEALDLKSPGIGNLLRAINDSDFRLDPVIVQRLLVEADADMDSLYRRWRANPGACKPNPSNPSVPCEVPLNHAIEELIKQTAWYPHPNSEELIRTLLDSPSHDVRENAANGLFLLNDLDGLWTTVGKAICEGDSTQIPLVAIEYWATGIYRSEVDNGGHEQYFFNSSSDTWRYALSGLRRIGEDARADLLTRAVGLFGPTGPSTDRETRIEQLEAFSDEAMEVLEQLDSAFYSLKTDLGMKAMLLAVEHADELRRYLESRGADG